MVNISEIIFAKAGGGRYAPNLRGHELSLPVDRDSHDGCTCGEWTPPFLLAPAANHRKTRPAAPSRVPRLRRAATAAEARGRLFFQGLPPLARSLAWP